MSLHSQPSSKSSSFKSRLASAFKPKPGAKKLTKGPPLEVYQAGSFGSAAQITPQTTKTISKSASVSQLQERPYVKPVNFYNKNTTGAEAQTGETWNETEMLHSLLRRDSNDSLASNKKESNGLNTDIFRKPGELMISRLPNGLWEHIVSYISPADAANLAFSCKRFYSILGAGPWIAVDLPENHQYKIEFLISLDRHYPNHLLCFPCATYHLRIQKGEERLKHIHTLNPVYNCPNPKLQSKARITPGWTLPFSFVQLAFRGYRYGPEYGIPLDNLNRRYKCRYSEWTHQVRYHFHKGHLLVRVISTAFADAKMPLSMQRHLLYWREDYTPYFSVCAHWRDGELMNSCKCALSHIPPQKESLATQLQKGPQFSNTLRAPQVFVTLCNNCRPVRRCPQCPTEYLVELKLAEDKSDTGRLNRFRQAIVVTRWSDLGDGISPESPEWKSCITEGDTGFDSFKMLSRRGLSGTFESQSGVTLPGQRMMSLNPQNEKLGEDGHNWY
jgi:hypothetical protein